MEAPSWLPAAVITIGGFVALWGRMRALVDRAVEDVRKLGDSLDKEISEVASKIDDVKERIDGHSITLAKAETERSMMKTESDRMRFKLDEIANSMTAIRAKQDAWNRRLKPIPDEEK